MADHASLSNYGIGLGTYKLTGQHCSEIVCSALKMGYRLIDTAVLYKNHIEIREGIARSGVNREDIYISSKIHDSTQKAQKQQKDAIRNSVEQILKELGITYLDQLLLHSAVQNCYLESWEILECLKQEGIVRNIGISNFRVDELEHLLSQCKIKPHVNQFEVSPFCTRDRLVSFCKQNGIIIQAYGSLTVARRLNDPKLISCSEILRVKPAFMLLYWALKKGYVIIPKSETEIHLMENFNVYEQMIDGDYNKIQNVIDELDKLNESYYTIKKHGDKD